MDGFINKQKVKIDQIKNLAGDDYVEVKENEQFKLSDDQKINVDQKFVNEELSNQRAFYDEYKKKFKNNYVGAIIYESNYKDPQDLKIQDHNQVYLNRKQRKQKARNSLNKWQNLVPYGLTLDKKNTGIYALDLMKGTIKYATIENKKDEIIENALKDAGSENVDLFKAYINQIKALGPDLEIEDAEKNKLDEKIVISQKSINEYTKFIKDAINNPVETIKTAINDAIFSYGKISPKLLEKHAIPQKFEVLKQIRDKYRAAHAILQSPEIDQRLVEIASEIKSNKLARDNVTLATEIYRRLDTDLCYTLEHYGIRYTDRKFLDKGSVETIAYENKSDGELTLHLLNAQRNKRVTKKENMVDNYWEERVRSSVLRKEEQKETENKNQENESVNKENKNEEFKDEFGIYRTVQKISESMSDVDAQKKELFDKAADGTKKLALAISDIDRELKAAKEAAKNEKSSLDKSVRTRLNWFIRRKEQQQLDLMQRVAAYMNAMRFLAGRDMINPNGTQILDELSAQNLKLKENKDNKFIDVSNNFSFTNEISYKNVMFLTDNTSSFNDFKKRILDKFKNHPRINILKNMLDNKNASKKYDILILKKENLEDLTIEEVGRHFIEQELSDVELKNLISDSVKDLMSDINVLYQKTKNKKIFLSTDNEKTNLIKDYLNIQKTNYAINRLLATKTSNPNNDFVANLFGKTETFKTILGDDFVNKKEWKYAGLKFKCVSDEMELYRLAFLSDYIHNKKYSNNMLRPNEKAELLKLNSKSKFNSNMLNLLNLFIGKMNQAESLRNRHDIELREFKIRNPELVDEIVDEEIHEEQIVNKNDNVIKNDDEIKNENEIKNDNVIKNENVIKNDSEIKNKNIHEDLERKKKEDEERLKLEREEIEKIIREEEEKEKREKEERKRKWKSFTKSNVLKNKYAIEIIDKKIPYTAMGDKDPGTDTWAHSLASLINYNAGKAVVSGKDILLSDKKKNLTAIFGDNRCLDGDIYEMGDFVFDYLPNTAVAKTKFDDYEFKEKDEFLAFIKMTIEKNRAPVVINRKQACMTVYGITKNNQLLCKRCTNDFVDDFYTEDPDEVFEYHQKYGDISMYWLQKVSNNEKEFNKEYPEFKLDKNKTNVTADNPINLNNQNDGIGISKTIEQKINGKTTKHEVNIYLPRTLTDAKTAEKNVNDLKKLETILTEPPILKYDEHVKVLEKDNVPQYEYQHKTNYCWACALSGLINYHANQKISSMDTIKNFKISIPEQKDTKIQSKNAYDTVKNGIVRIKNGIDVGNPTIYGDYLFTKLPNTAIRTAQISKYEGKIDICKRRLKEILSEQLKNGPVAIYRNEHYVLCCELDGDNIKVKDSNRRDANEIKNDLYTINNIFNSVQNDGGHIELVWLENIKGKEKELEAEFEDFTYDEKEMTFSKKDKNADYRPSGTDTILHKNGIESGTKQPNDVVLNYIYLPKQMKNE